MKELGGSPPPPAAPAAPFSAEIERAATALRAEGKELAHVLFQLRQRCGAQVLRSPAGFGVVLQVRSVDGATPLHPGTLHHLAESAGLKRPEVVCGSAATGTAAEARVSYLEEYPPRNDHPGLPPKLRSHAESLTAGFAGHHDRALDFFTLICEHRAGASVEVISERRRAAHGGGGGGASGASGGARAASYYPEVPNLEVSARDLQRL